MANSLFALVHRIQQNHALEHATMHLLTRDHVGIRLVGRSDWRGFVLYGKVDTQAVLAALQEALCRLKNDQGELAVHPRCGTNLTTGALLTGGAAYLAATLGHPSRGRRLIRTVVVTLIAIALARPLGLAVQRHLTTRADLGDLYVRAVYCDTQRGYTIHRIVTAS